MKKIEDFLNKYSWLMKLGVGALFVIWAMQAANPLKEMLLHEREYQRNIEQEREALKEYKQYADVLYEKAMAEGTEFGYGEYFQNLKKIDIKRKELENKYKLTLPRGFSTDHAIDQMGELIRANVEMGFTTNDAAAGPAQEYNDWMKSGGVEGDEFRKAVDERGWRKNISDVSGWLFALYLRGIPLLFILYILRMSGRKGILQTILADKKRFLLAVIFWPLYFSRYPFNVVREIVVEAELRRLDGLFRKFSPIDKLRIQKIANNDQYDSWRKKFRRDHAGRLRYAFWVALLATIIIHALSPAIRADEKNTGRAGPSISIQHGQDGQDRLDNDDVCETENRIFSPPIFSFERLRTKREIFRFPPLEKRMDSVPRFGCFSRLEISFSNH